MGGSAQTYPETLMQKILMMYLAYIGLYCSGEIFSSIIDLKFVYKTESFDTYEQLYKTILPIESNYYTRLSQGKVFNTDPYVNETVKKILGISSTMIKRYFHKLYTKKKKKKCNLC